ncbi:lipase family protein [Mycobacterium sp. SMC-4]|uniref:lipase family protein n=1 Tax=Mycobacterium sp. SMC-4 TaxID=2857059 RepID=UPI003D08581F
MHHRRRSRGADGRALIALTMSGRHLLLILVLLLPLVAVKNFEPQLPTAPALAPIVMPLPDIPGDVWQRRGEVLHREVYADAPLEDRGSVVGEAWRAVYTSVSGTDGQSREVSGAFFVPRGVPPEAGWPVISLAHGTTGVGINCGPTRQPDMEGYGPIVESLLASKYAVAMTDYEGLGDQGVHPYLEPRTAAFNTIDAVRAMREIAPNVSTRWIGVGYSQGGQAVWAANELNDFYGADLELQGSVALAPAANVTGAVDLALSRSMTDEQRALFPLMIVGLLRYSPDLDEDAFLRGDAQSEAAGLRQCGVSTGQSPYDKPRMFPWQRFIDRIRESNDVRPETAEDADALREALRKVALPQRPLQAPMLVVTGLLDALLLASWVETAVEQSCALGGRIEYVEVPNAGHQDILWRRSDLVAHWIADRFAGLAAPTNCPADDE